LPAQNCLGKVAGFVVGCKLQWDHTTSGQDRRCRIIAESWRP